MSARSSPSRRAGELRRIRIACSYDPQTIAARRLDRLLGAVPDGGRRSAPRRPHAGSRSMPRPRRWRAPRSAPGRPGTRINLERSLKIGDELGGHIVTGHVDGVAEIVERHATSTAWRTVRHRTRPGRLARFIAEKGSVCLDGTSLTVNSVDGHRLHGAADPAHARGHHLGRAQGRRQLNLEVDLMARYAARLVEAK